MLFFRNFTIAVTILGVSTGIFTALVPLFKNDYSYASLEVKVWTPIAIDKRNYWYFYTYQVIPITLASLQAVAFGAIFVGLIREATLQLDILSSRFSRMKEQVDGMQIKNALVCRDTIIRTLTVKYISHHDMIHWSI